MEKLVPVILGPTCSWKSAVAYELCRRHSGEVISCDSMQIYRGLAIGTAQPTVEERRCIPHHLVDELPITAIWNADKFVPAANQLIKEIFLRGHQPIVAGGTGMYAKALCYEMSLLPGNPELAATLRGILSEPDGAARLREELKSGAGADEIPADLLANPRRVARAVEVLRLTGLPPWRIHPSKLPPRPLFRQFCIIPDFEMLKSRIRQRCKKMIEMGWIDECMSAAAKGLLNTPTAWQALGYRDIISFFKENPHGEHEELAVILSNRTIQFARRQMTWFKHQHNGAVILSVTNEDNAVDRLIQRIEEELCH